MKFPLSLLQDEKSFQTLNAEVQLDFLQVLQNALEMQNAQADIATCTEVSHVCFPGELANIFVGTSKEQCTPL